MSSSARIDELRRKFDENPRRYFAPLANEYRKAGDFDQAIFICQEYLPQQPGHMSGHIVFGQALFEAKRLPEARTVFETALSLDPENLIALRHLADISRDLGETAVAKGWYERVLQADPRNEEIAAIMASMAAVATPPPPPPAAAMAPTAEVPAMAAKPSPAAVSPSAPTVELSAAAVKEMMRARQANQSPAGIDAGAGLTLDDAATVEISTIKESMMTLDGLEATSFQAPTEIPVLEDLGLETNAAPGQTAEPPAFVSPTLDELDTLSLDDLNLPGASSTPAVAPPPAAPEAAVAGGDGLLDFGSFSFGGDAPAEASPAPTAAEIPIDGGHDDGGLLDFDLPSAPAAPAAPPLAEPSIPTLVMDAVKSTVPMVKDTIEDTVPLVMDMQETAVPTVVDAVMNVPTLVMDSIRVESPKTPEPSQDLPFVTEAEPMDRGLMAPAPEARAPAPPPPVLEPEPEPEVAPERQAPPFVTETMAQLYLAQGHRNEAIEIYRQLVEARPNDAELRARLATIEQGDQPLAAETVASPGAARPEELPPRFTGTGPSIRSVLRNLFGLEAHSGNGSSDGAPLAEAGSIDILFASDSFAEALSPLAVAFDGGFVATTGSIDELFSSETQ